MSYFPSRAEGIQTRRKSTPKARTCGSRDSTQGGLKQPEFQCLRKRQAHSSGQTQLAAGSTVWPSRLERQSLQGPLTGSGPGVSSWAPAQGPSRSGWSLP